MKKLCICEKRSAAMELLESGYFGKLEQYRGYMENDKYIITWCQGHLYRKQTPREIDEVRGLKFSIDPSFDYAQPDLPSLVKEIPDVIPDKDPQNTIWKVKKDAIEAIRKCFARKDYDEIILMGDPDAEGQKINTDVIRYNKQLIRSGVTYSRFWLTYSYKNYDVVKEAFENREPASNPKYMNLLYSCEARAMGDYALGMVTTKVMSDSSGSTLRSGRVISLLVGMIGRREDAIKNFVSKPYYQLKGEYQGITLSHYYSAIREDNSGKEVQAKETRYYDEPSINAVIQDCENVRLKGKVVRKSKRTTSSKKPPMYHTDDFNSAFMRRYKVDMDMGNACLEWLQKHDYTTYPRTNGRYYSKKDFKTFEQMVGDVSTYFAKEISELQKQDKNFTVAKITPKHPIFDDAAAVKQNHLPLGIVKPLTAKDLQLFASHPTHETRKDPNNPRQAMKLTHLKEAYDMIATRCLIQVLPDDVVVKENLTIDVAGHLFEAEAEKVIYEGWKKFDPDATKGGNSELDVVLNEGDEVKLDKLFKTEGKTTPPKPFTRESLLNALMFIHTALAEEYDAIDDEQVRQEKRKDFNRIKNLITTTDGIGTGATRETILGKLKHDKVIELTGKNGVVSLTENGRYQYANLPKEMMSIEMTAIFEQYLSDIRTGDAKKEDFINEIKQICKKISDDVLNRKIEKNNHTQFAGGGKPTKPMVDYAKKLAERAGVKIPRGTLSDFAKTKDFIDSMASTHGNTQMGKPTEKMVQFARNLAEQNGVTLDETILDDFDKTKAFIDAQPKGGNLSEKQIKFAQDSLKRLPNVEVEAILASGEFSPADVETVKKYLEEVSNMKRTLSEKQWYVLTNEKNAHLLSAEAKSLIDSGVVELDKDQYKVLKEALDKIFASR